MPADDRERNFERALARHLRSASSDSSCPDAEILAAYHERSLSLDEMARWKEHIAECARCQDCLALVEQTEHLAAGAWEQERVLFPAEETPQRLSAQFADTAVPRSTLAAAPVSKQDSVPAAIRKAAPHLPWRWVAPLGLAAAAAIVWVGVQELRTQHYAPLQQPAAQIAENRVAAPPAPATRVAPMDEMKRDVSPPKPRNPQPSGGVALNAPAAPSSPSATVNAPAKPGAKPPRSEPNNNLLNGSSSNSELLVVPPSAPVAGYAEKEQNADQAARLNSDFEAAKKARSEAPPVPAAAATLEVQAPTHNKAAAAQVTSYQNQFAAQLLTLAKVDPHYVVAPGNIRAWRLGGAGSIDHSTDAGKTWQPQTSGVTSDLTSGFASSDTVCWVVGKAGTILLTTDAGKHWKSLTSPIAADLGGIHATDAMHASVWDVPNRNSYETADGGATWTRTANE
ncbi:MAG TPA: YCF48-related protein [Verrucomicrobiae bacterium]|nr:YCF48-related protein [Verrucomicrobiae bacterium]